MYLSEQKAVHLRELGKTKKSIIKVKWVKKIPINNKLMYDE